MSSHFLSGIFGRAFGSNRNKRPTVKRGAPARGSRIGG